MDYDDISPMRDVAEVSRAAKEELVRAYRTKLVRQLDLNLELSRISHKKFLIATNERYGTNYTKITQLSNRQIRESLIRVRKGEA